MSQITDYVINHSSDVILNIIFAFFGLFLSLLCTPKKKDNPHINNGTSITQIQQIIQNNNYSSNHYYPTQRSSQSRNNSMDSSDGETLGIYFVAAVLLAFFFNKYHQVLMDYTMGFIIMGLTSTITVAIKLYVDNQYDNLNKYWSIVSLIIIGMDFFTLNLMSKQISSSTVISSISDFINQFGMNGILQVSYFALGFIFIQFLNLLLLILLIHVFAVNQYLARDGSIAAFFVRKTRRFASKPLSLAFITILLSTISILLSSGVLYDWVSQGINHSTTLLDNFTNSFSNLK